ncbi:MAG TPA: PQQ-binding-like beta-propeller repeat protein [Acidimicrobiales bacterium]
MQSRCVAARAGAVLIMAAGLAGCWRQPGFGPLHQGSNPLERQLTVANVATLHPAWTATVDDGPVRSDPVVSGSGLVHVSDDRAAYGLEAPSGARRWRTQVVPSGGPPGMVAGPVSSDETQVVVPWGGVPDSGGVSHLAAGTGAPAGVDPGIGVRSATLRDPWTVEPFSGFVEGTVAGAGVHVDGPTDWSLLTGFEVGPEIPPPTPAAVTATRFLVGIEDSWFGSDLLAAWNLDATGCTPTSPVDGCRPVLSVALDGVPTGPVVADGEAVAYVATEAGTVYAVDIAGGAVLWTADVGAAVSRRPALTAGALFVVTDAGDLVSLAPGGCGAATCAPTRTTDLAGAPVTDPAVAGGVVYVASAGGVVEAFAAAGPGGAGPLWSTSVGAEVTGGPTVASGLLLVGTADGRMLAFAPGA